MAIYYIENENGSFLSSDGSRRFMKLSGQRAYEYLKSPEGRKKRFMRTSAHEDGGEEEFVEVPANHMREHRKAERREQYISDCIDDSGFITISLYALEDDNDSDLISGEELIGDPSQIVEKQVLHELDLEILRGALRGLNSKERSLIDALYLNEESCSEREMAGDMGVSQVAIHKRKRLLLSKLRKFF